MSLKKTYKAPCFCAFCGSNSVISDVTKKGIWFLVTHCGVCGIEMLKHRLGCDGVARMENFIREQRSTMTNLNIG